MSNPTVTVYSIDSTAEPADYTDDESTISKHSLMERRTSHLSSTKSDSKLNNGGLCGLQNLGNTV
jgi:hypothetical protein